MTLGVHLNGSTDSAADLVLSRLGVWPVDVRDAARTLALLVVLFLGPLYEKLVADGSWRSLSPRTVKATLYDTWAGWRNYVVGPASEELIFRSLNVSLLLRAGVCHPSQRHSGISATIPPTLSAPTTSPMITDLAS